MAENKKVTGQWPHDEPVPVGNEKQRAVAKQIADRVKGVKPDPKKIEDDKHVPKPSEPQAQVKAPENTSVAAKPVEVKAEGTVKAP